MLETLGSATSLDIAQMMRRESPSAEQAALIWFGCEEMGPAGALRPHQKPESSEIAKIGV